MLSRRLAASIIVLATCVPAFASNAQSVTTVRVPLSVTQTFAPNACTAETKKYDAKADTDVDTVRLSVQDDRNQPANTAVELDVAVADVEQKLAAATNALAVAAKKHGTLPGQVLTIRQTANGQLVCAVLVPLHAVPKAPEDTARRAIRIGVGASFDFLNGVSGTDLYYDLTVLFPRILAGGRWTTFGIDGAFLNGRTTARPDTIQRLIRYFRPRGAGNDTTRVVRIESDQLLEETHEQLGLYLGPTYQLVPRLYLVGHVEILKREVRSRSTPMGAKQDTILASELPSRTVVRLSDPVVDTVSRRFTEYEPFFGGGLLLVHRFSDMEFRVKPVIGRGSTRRGPGTLYSVQFRVTDFENGLKIGGEIRGRLPHDDPSILVFLAKDYSFTRLADFLVGGDDDK